MVCTSYTELCKCTPGQIDRVLYERQHPESKVQTESMLFGTLRHLDMEAEARDKLKVPDRFGIDDPVAYIEHEFATNILDGVIVHSRPDIVSIESGTIYDFKTVLDDKQGAQKIIESYRHVGKQRQILFYAFQLGLHGIPIKHGMYLIEIWNKDRTEILGYETVEFPITMRDIAPVVDWAKDRAALLLSASNELENT